MQTIIQHITNESHSPFRDRKVRIADDETAKRFAMDLGRIAIDEGSKLSVEKSCEVSKGAFLVFAMEANGPLFVRHTETAS